VRTLRVGLFVGIVTLGPAGVWAAGSTGPSPWARVPEAALGGPSERALRPGTHAFYRLDRAALDAVFAQAPLEFTPDAGARAAVLALPMPDGTLSRFRVEESPIMEPALADRHPGIRTYRGQGVDDPTASARLGWTSAGFHAIVLGGRGSVYVDPVRRGDTAHYVSYFKRDALRTGEPFQCFLDEAETAAAERDGGWPLVPSGATLRTYRLALAANFEYSDFHSPASPPLKADVLNNGIIPTMNRVTGIYERDVAVRMVLVAGEESIIFVDSADPYDNNSPSQMLNINQSVIDGAIGFANYDIGHVFSTGGGGIAGLRVVCGGSKARGVTGRGSPIGDPFDVDYVAHEMGHQFGGNHTFNGNAGSCAGNRSASTAYEVGSGSTIMAYAGICGAQDLQPNSDEDFHVASFAEIVAFTTNPGSGDACPVRTATGNTPPTIDAGAAFSIPSRTPFTLTASGSDPDGDTLTYDWDEFDLGPAGSGQTDNGSSPILRSFLPTPSPSRTFPKLSDILNGTTTYGEILPTTTRTMRFRVMARDNRAGAGGADFDETTVAVQSGAGPFRVTSPNTPVTLGAGQPHTVTWDVAGTTGAPINTATVDVLLSTDGGQTFPTVLAAATANDGTQVVTVPNVNTTTARVKIQAVGNVFFDISDVNFTIALINQLSIDDAVVRERIGALTGIQFTVSLAPASAGAVTVNYATSDGTATAGSDYVAAAGPLSFAPGMTSRTVIVTVNPDALVEGMETFTVTLSGAAGATIGDGTATGRILDPPPGADFNADGRADLVWRHDTSGENVLWLMNGATLVSGTFTTPPTLADPGWRIVGTNDFNADGRPDLLWRHGGSGENVLWYMNGTVLQGGVFLTPASLPDLGWGMSGTGDFDVDGKPDILWRHGSSGQIVIWYMNGATLVNGTFTTPSVLADVGWQAVGTGDFNFDGRADILWRHVTSGENVVWYMNGSVLISGTFLNPPSLPDVGWRMVATGDYNQDGKVDIVWRHSGSGQNVIWFMDGVDLISGTFTTPSTLADPGWKIVGPR
jgi:hypothetical protein